MFLDPVELPHLLAQLSDLLLQPLGLGLDLRRLGAVGRLQSIKVALDALLDLLLAPVDLAGGEVAVAAVDRLELAAVDGHDGLREQLELAAQRDEAPADVADACAVVVPEVGDGLEVWRQAAGQPHQLDVALGFALQPAAGLDAIKVAVDVELEQNRRVVRGAARRSRVDATEAQRLKIEFIDEDIDNAYRVVLANVVVQTLGQQCKLASVLAFDESLHRPPRLNGLAYFNWHQASSEAFSHSLGHYRVLPLLPEFRQRYPEVQVEIHLSNRNIDFAEEGYDLAIRGRAPTDSNLIARKLEDAELVLVASPSYIKRAGEPKSLEDLENHDCIQFELPSTGRRIPWPFHVNAEADNKVADVATTGGYSCSEDVLGIVTLARSGAGVVQTYRFIVEKDLEKGDLIELLPQFGGTSRPFILLYPHPHARHLSLRVRTFVDFLVGRLMRQGTD